MTRSNGMDCIATMIQVLGSWMWHSIYKRNPHGEEHTGVPRHLGVRGWYTRRVMGVAGGGITGTNTLRVNPCSS